MADRVTERVHVDAGGRSWAPAQILALVIGVVFVVLGGVALLRTGIQADTILAPTTTVAGLAYTPLLAIIEVVFGLILMAMGAFPGASDGIVFLGLLALAFGLLLVIEPAAFQDSIAAGRAHGWFYVVTGGLAALTAFATPSVARRVTTRRVEEREPQDRPRREPRTDDTQPRTDDTQRMDPRDRESS